jgi:hypothetical protein
VKNLSCENGLASPYNSQNTKTLGVRFSALLTEGGAERLELARAQRVARARLQNSAGTLTSMRNCKTLEVRFRALLNQAETQQLEVVRA